MLQYPRQCPTTKNDPASHANSAKVEKPWSTLNSRQQALREPWPTHAACFLLGPNQRQRKGSLDLQRHLGLKRGGPTVQMKVCCLSLIFPEFTKVQDSRWH